MTKEELVNAFKYIVKKCNVLIAGDYYADEFTQNNVEDIAELCNHILDGDYGKLIEDDAQTEATSPELWEAAKWYARTSDYSGLYCPHVDKTCAFVAGARWQKEQIEEEAVEGEVIFLNDDKNWLHIPGDKLVDALKQYTPGDKVKLTILKKD